MNLSLLSSVVAILIVTGVLQAQPQTNSESLRCGPQTEGFELCVQLEKKKVNSGGPVLLKVAIKNATKKELLLGEFTPETDNRVTMIQEGNGIVKPTPKGRILINRSERYLRSFTIPMAPGEVRIETLALDKLFEISTPGKYSISVTRIVGNEARNGIAKVKSNTIVLSVR